jgi:Putative DNA-binding domain
MPFETTVRAFAAALDDPLAPTPAMTHGRMGAPDARRFAVYRNNVAVGLIGALEARYPVSRRIAGDDLFRGVARAFMRAHKPRSPIMIAYGEDFPEFAAAYLAAAEAGPDLAGLPDVARLENAWVEAYHAEDASVATVSELAALSPDCLPGTRIAFHPAARLTRFATPAASVWASAQGSGGPAAPAEGTGEDALITRPDCDVRVRVLPSLGYDFALRLREGATLIEAAAALNDPAFDFGAHLVGLIDSGAVAFIIPGNCHDR